jgi:hypothetical protein
MLSAASLILSLSISTQLPQEEFFGVYMKGTKVGYSIYASAPTQYKGTPALKSTTEMRVAIGLIGSEVKIVIKSETISISGKPVLMNFFQESAGRTQSVEAVFSKTSILAKIDNNGEKSTSTLEIPADAPVMDDVLSPFVGNQKNSNPSFYIFDPSTISLVKNKLVPKGSQKIEVEGRKENANVFIIEEPRLSTTIYLSDQSKVLKATSTLGIDLVAESKERATEKSLSSEPVPDLADLSMIVPKPAIKDPLNVRSLKVSLTADNLPNIPSDSSQTAKKVNGKWELTITPLQLKEAKTTSIASAASQRKEWTKPSHLMPSDKAQFKTIGKKIIGKSTDVKSATLAIRKWVNQQMVPNSGIGILRDATEVLKAKEGVCRDYAILTGTLLRAVGIPTRLASGLVNFEGNFYYHAWVEVFTGIDWMPVDSVPETDMFTATHVKLSQGNVDTAFNFTILSNARIDVLSQK